MSRLINIAYQIPQEKITNDYLSDRFPKWTPEKIFEKTGIRERGKSAITETAGDLAVLASEKLFSNSERRILEIKWLMHKFKVGTS